MAQRNTLVDEAHFSKPIDIGKSNVQQVRFCLEEGTIEMRDLVLNECELIFECRVCHNLFRKLSNFLHHKREFCKNMHLCKNMPLFIPVHEEVIIMEPDSSERNNSHKQMEKLEEKTTKFTEQILLSRLIETTKEKDQPMPLQNDETCKTTRNAVTFYTNLVNDMEKKKKIVPKKRVISLRSIPTNANAVYQTVMDTSQNELAVVPPASTTLAEIRQEVEKARTAVITPDQMHISIEEKNDKKDSAGRTRFRKRVYTKANDFICLTCKVKHQSAKELEIHMCAAHSNTKMLYPCPYKMCKFNSIKLWSVLRHLMNLHNKSKEEAYKLKKIIKNKAFSPNSDGKMIDNDLTPQSNVIEKLKKKNDKIKNKSNFHVCIKCKRTFARKSAQVTHQKYCSGIKDQNKGEKDAAHPFEPKLSEKFDKSMIAHNNSQEKDTSAIKRSSNGYENVDTIIDIERKLCLICNQTYTREYNLRRHAAIHIGCSRKRKRESNSPEGRKLRKIDESEVNDADAMCFRKTRSGRCIKKSLPSASTNNLKKNLTNNFLKILSNEF